MLAWLLAELRNDGAASGVGERIQTWSKDFCQVANYHD